VPAVGGFVSPLATMTSTESPAEAAQDSGTGMLTSWPLFDSVTDAGATAHADSVVRSFTW
jgi:hypothetical protein